MRLIDADALKYTQTYEPCGNGQYKAVNIVYETDIEAAPTIEPKTGKWISKKDARGNQYTICSNCETEIQWRDSRGVLLRVDMQNAHYCPNCGAKDGEERR